MKTIPISQKFQVVIPKAARKTMGLTHATKGLYVKSVSKDEIVLAKAPDLDKWLTDLLESSPPTNTNAVGRVRKLRDEWSHRDIPRQ